MSVHEAIAWAIEVSREEPMAARMLLIVGLATRCGDRDNGFVVWPSVQQIAEDTCMSRASVQRWMRHLEEKQLVERFEAKRETGAQSSNRYRLPVKAVFYHPTKGAVPQRGASPCDGPRLNLRQGGPQIGEAGGASYGEAPYEGQLEHQLEDRESTPASEELDLGLPPIHPKDPTPAEVAAYIEERWAARAFVTPLRGGKLSQANAEKAHKLGKAAAWGEGGAIDTWSEIFDKIDGSDFLQGKVPGREGRPSFKLTLGFLLEKRNFDKTLEGRFDGKSSGEQRRGSTSEATGRVLDRIRSSDVGSAGRGDSPRALAGPPSRFINRG